MDFELVGQIRNIEPIALGRAVRELARLRKQGAVEKIEGHRPESGF